MRRVHKSCHAILNVRQVRENPEGAVNQVSNQVSGQSTRKCGQHCAQESSQLKGLGSSPAWGWKWRHCWPGRCFDARRAPQCLAATGHRLHHAGRCWQFVYRAPLAKKTMRRAISPSELPLAVGLRYISQQSKQLRRLHGNHHGL